MNLDLYLHYTGSDMKAFRETFKESAERQVKIRLALEKIAEVENLTATAEDIEAEYEKIAKELRHRCSESKRHPARKRGLQKTLLLTKQSTW